jgi:hypothetical protein
MQITIHLELSPTEAATLERYRTTETKTTTTTAALKRLIYAALLDRNYQYLADDQVNAINAELHDTWYEIISGE